MGYSFNPITGMFDLVNAGPTATTVDTIGTIDSTTPSANGAAIVGHNLVLQSASATVPGEVNTTTQTFAGTKTIDLGANSTAITAATGDNSTKIATTAYVQGEITGLNPEQACYAATTENLVGTYSNGASGIGATFTITATGAFTLDGTTPAANSRILIKDQSTTFQNGIYTLSTAGSIGVSPILTRATNYDTPSEINSAGLIPVISGTTNALSSWQQISTVTTIGTDAITFQSFTANPSLYMLKANNLNDVANSTTAFNNISGLTTLGDTIYGGAAGTRSRLAGNTTTTKSSYHKQVMV